MILIDRGKKIGFHPRLFAEYLDFLRQHQCVAEGTIGCRKVFIKRFLNFIGERGSPSRLHELSPKRIHDYIIATLAPLHRASRKQLVSSLRSFLRFAHVRGYLKRSLVDAVPVITTRKLDRVPQGISWDSVQKLLRVPNRQTHSGRRDYAILLLLATYGVRIGQVTALKLQDLRWAEGVIHFQPSKGGQPLCFPLQQAVAHALLAYIKKVRKQLSFQKVFLTIQNPQRPLARNAHLSTIIDGYYKQAGIITPAQPTHAIRHAFATRLMEQGTPIKTIADLLGHRSIDTAFIYTKVDLLHLRTLAREWPEVAS